MLDKVEVPLGKPAPTKVSGTTLLYNEYIVYDVAQVILDPFIKPLLLNAFPKRN